MPPRRAAAAPDLPPRGGLGRLPVRLLLTAGALAGLILPAAIPAALAQSARTGARQVGDSPVSVAITSMNPPYAK